MTRIEHADAASVHLLGHILKRVLERILEEDPDARARAGALKGSVLLVASGMPCVLQFEGEAIRISCRVQDRATARISGGLHAFLALLNGVHPLWLVLGGRLRVRGNLLQLLRLRSLFGSGGRGRHG